MQVDYPDSLPDLLQTTRSQFEAEARMAMAVKLYELKRLSSSMAARVAGVTPGLIQVWRRSAAFMPLRRSNLLCPWNFQKPSTFHIFHSEAP
jgi:hypothetical protein